MHTIIVRPNRSLHRTELGLLGLGLCAALTLGGVLTWLFGFWPILAFDGLALIGLVAAVWFANRAGGYLEEIRIDDDWVSVVKGVCTPQSTFRARRPWTRLIEDTQGPLKRYRLWIGSSGRFCEIGTCLGEDERRELFWRLRRYFNFMSTSAHGAGSPGNGTAGTPTEIQAGDIRT